MPGGKRAGGAYADDDFDDGYDDYEDEAEEVEEEYYDQYAIAEQEALTAPQPAKGWAGQQQQQGGRSSGSPKPTKAPAMAAGASALARSLCDAAPLLPNGKRQKGAKPSAKASKPSGPLRHPVPDTPGVQRFAFDTPSPDDIVFAARRQATGRAPSPEPDAAAAAAAAGIKAMNLGSSSGAGHAASGKPAPSAASTSTAVIAAAKPRGPGSVAGPVPQGEEAGPSSTSRRPQQPRRRVSEYTLEPELTRVMQAAQAASSGGKQELHLVVLGHVDAGKSTLMGRLLHDLGLVNSKTAHRNERESAAMGKPSFKWAWVLDERAEERARGLTVDVAEARFETPNRRVRLLDAPGHRDFVPNAISGAAQADAALLVVDGSPGGFEAGFERPTPGSPGGGQTREHAQLARSLGVEQLAVVVTKLDVCDFSEARFGAVRDALLPFLRQCGFTEASVQWLPAVAPSGLNLTQPPVAEPLLAWFKGPTVLQAIDAFRPGLRNLNLPFRMPLANVFKGPRGGLLVSGKVVCGAVGPGSSVLISPPGSETANIKSLEIADSPATIAAAGDSATLSLAGVDATSLRVGSMLSHPDWPVPLALRFEARVLVLEIDTPILPGQQVTVHAHTSQEAGRVSKLASLLDPRTGEVSKLRPRILLKGQTAVLEVILERAMCLELYADCRALGRVALREGGKTLAVGILTALPGL